MDTRWTEQPTGARTSIRARGGSLAPGGVVGDGRYRLLAQLGVDARGDAHLWRARDGQLRRDVALTIIVGDPADLTAARRSRRTLERAAHAAQFAHPSVARVLDVLSLGNGVAAGEGLLGIVVSEWGKGTDLIDILDEGPVSPGTACRMVEPLVDAVEKAHHRGLVLGLDHPQRIRASLDGTLRVAFPGPLPDATLRDDIKALGAVLYLLLTGRWPLDGGPDAFPRAPHAPTGKVVPPRSLQPHIPAELSSLAVRTLSDGDDGGVRTSAAFLRVLHQVVAAEERQALIKQGEMEDPSELLDDDGTVWTTRRPVSDASQRKKVALGATALIVAAVAVIAWIGLSVISLFQPDDDATGPSRDVADVGKQGGSDRPQSKPKPTDVGKAVAPSEIRVYNPEGTGDFVERAAFALDGDAATLWQSDQYKQQFPALKNGVGLAATFSQPVDLAKITIKGASPGTVVEIRASEHPNPYLSDARVVAGPTMVSGDSTDIALSTTTQTTHVFIWITQLGDTGTGQFQSQIADLEFFPAYKS